MLYINMNYKLPYMVAMHLNNRIYYSDNIFLQFTNDITRRQTDCQLVETQTLYY